MKTLNAFILAVFFALCSCGNDDDNLQENNLPIAIDQTFSIEEGAINLTEIGQIEASDPQNLSLTYSITSQSVNGAFYLDGQTGLLFVNEEFPYDYETNQSLTASILIENEAQFQTEITVTVNIIDLEYPQTGLRAAYFFDSDTSATALDITGNHNGEIIGNVALGMDRNGITNKAFNFTGGRIRVLPEVLNGLTDFTICGWVNPSTNGGARALLVKGASVSKDLELSLVSGNNMILRYIDPISSNFNTTNTNTNAIINSSNWYHFTVKVENGTTWSLYVNGQLIESTTFNNANVWSNENLNIGAYGTTQQFDGLMDDIFVYERALSEIEINKLGSDTY